MEASSGMQELGDWYVSRTNVVDGLRWLHKAADLDNESAWISLAQIYESGTGVSKDLGEAISLWKKAANSGDTSAKLHLAELYRDNSDVKDPQESFKWFLRVAQQFDSNTNFYTREALISVANAYDKGLGVAQDKAEAVKWLTKGAEANDPEVEWRLGVKYDLGDGVDADKQKAFQWYLKAANTPPIFGKIVSPGVAEAQRNLGYLYQDGEGVGKDNQEAFNWFMKAANNGDDAAQYNVGKAYETGISVLQDKQEAFKWYQKSANGGNKAAEFKLGNLYSENIHTSQNRIEAYKWYTLAAAQGDEDAAKLRDIVERAMNQQEVIEAGRRAKAFSTGQPAKDDVSAIASVPKSAATSGIDSDKTGFEVLGATAKPTEQNDTWWRYGYRLIVRNNGWDTDPQFFEIQFLDAEGYVIETKTERAVVKPGATETITGEALVDVPGAARVAKLKAFWKP
jgi:TPR repeat protein